MLQSMESMHEPQVIQDEFIDKSPIVKRRSSVNEVNHLLDEDKHKNIEDIIEDEMSKMS